MQNTQNESAVKKLSFKSQASKQIVADKFSFVLFTVSIFAVLCQVFLILFSKKNLPAQIPFYYSRPWGETMLASPIMLWGLPAIAVIFSVLNFFIAFFLARENFFLMRVLVIFAFIICVTTLYGVFKIVNLLV